MFVYILTNERRTTLYIGVTNDLANHVWQHGEMKGTSFSHRYNLTVLIYFEEYPDPTQAIAREKQLKGWSRAKKEALIAKMNPEWRNLIWEFTEHEPPGISRGPSTPRRATCSPVRQLPLVPSAASAHRRSAQDDSDLGGEE